MPRTTSAGKCHLCGRSYRKSGITTHLRRCLARHAGPDSNGGGNSGSLARSIHLAVADTYRPEYWLHLAVPTATTLEQLDAYLRGIWLECCHHFSSFTVGMNYYDHTMVEDGDDFFTMLDDFRAITHGDLKVPLATAAPPGTRFRHEYDFGATTQLALRSVAEIDTPVADADAGNRDSVVAANTDAASPIRLLARNDAPEFACRFCTAPATWVSPAPDDWIAMTAGVCDQCIPHLENADHRLPIVNSPRSGVCGYTGAPIVIVADDE